MWLNGIAASNGIFMNSTNNIQLGGTLQNSRIISADTSSLYLIGNPLYGSLLKSTSNSSRAAIHAKNTSAAGIGFLAECSGGASGLFMGGNVWELARQPLLSGLK